MRIRIYSLMIFLFLAACSSSPIEEELATEELPSYRVVISSAVAPIRPVVESCAATVFDAVIAVQEGGADQNSDLFIRFGEPETLPEFSAAIAYEEIMIVYNPENATRTINQGQTRRIFQGRVTDWDEVGGQPGDIHVWVMPEGADSQQLLDRNYFSGQPVTPNAQISPHPALMFQTIIEDWQAIGYLPAAWTTEDLETFETGVSAAILVLADAEPEAPLLALVACLQGDLGQDLLGINYSLEP